MRGGAGAMDAGVGGGGGGKRGDACLAEIQRLEKNRANRRNRMEKARCFFSFDQCDSSGTKNTHTRSRHATAGIG